MLNDSYGYVLGVLWFSFYISKGLINNLFSLCFLIFIYLLTYKTLLSN